MHRCQLDKEGNIYFAMQNKWIAGKKKTGTELGEIASARGKVAKNASAR